MKHLQTYENWLSNNMIKVHKSEDTEKERDYIKDIEVDDEEYQTKSTDKEGKPIFNTTEFSDPASMSW